MYRTAVAASIILVVDGLLRARSRSVWIKRKSGAHQSEPKKAMRARKTCDWKRTKIARIFLPRASRENEKLRRTKQRIGFGDDGMRWNRKSSRRGNDSARHLKFQSRFLFWNSQSRARRAQVICRRTTALNRQCRAPAGNLYCLFNRKITGYDPARAHYALATKSPRNWTDDEKKTKNAICDSDRFSFVFIAHNFVIFMKCVYVYNRLNTSRELCARNSQSLA